jgi:hypothetical protein
MTLLKRLAVAFRCRFVRHKTGLIKVFKLFEALTDLLLAKSSLYFGQHIKKEISAFYYTAVGLSICFLLVYPESRDYTETNLKRLSLEAKLIFYISVV